MSGLMVVWFGVLSMEFAVAGARVCLAWYIVVR